MAVVRESLIVGADEGDGDTTGTLSVPVPAASERLLVILTFLETNGAGGDHVSTVTWNGITMTELAKTWTATWTEIQAHYLLEADLSTTTADAVVTATAALEWPGRLVAQIFSGVSQSNPFHGVNMTTQGHAVSSITSTRTLAPGFSVQDFLLDALCIDAVGHSPATVDPWTLFDYSDPAQVAVDTAGSRADMSLSDGSFTWDWTTAAPFSHMAIGIRASGNEPPAPPVSPDYSVFPRFLHAGRNTV